MTHRLDLDRYRALLVSDTHSLADVAGVDPAAHVPSCPDWDVTALLHHLYAVQEFWRLVVEHELQDREQVVRGDRPADDAVASALRDGGDHLAQVLAAADPELEVYSWADERTVAWITRRQALEAAVHRWDGQNAVGPAEPIDMALAVDGVDEWFEFIVEPTSGHSVIRLEASDADAVWHCDTGGNIVPVSAPDGVVHASASDLLLGLWRRRLIADQVTRGDTDLARALVRTAR